MKPTSLAISSVLALLPLASVSQAAITYTDPYFQSMDPVIPGTGYTWNVNLGSNGFETTWGLGDATDVGVWSWRQSPGGTTGWGHTSDWAKLTLTENATLTIVMGRNSSIPDPANPGGYLPVDKLFPSFSVWSGTYTRTEWNMFHNYPNSSALVAAGITGIVGYVDNSEDEIASLTLNLPAGVYTIAFGGNNPNGNNSSDPPQGYYASFTTVPEPSVAVLTVMASGLLAFRRRL